MKLSNISTLWLLAGLLAAAPGASTQKRSTSYFNIDRMYAKLFSEPEGQCKNDDINVCCEILDKSSAFPGLYGMRCQRLPTDPKDLEALLPDWPPEIYRKHPTCALLFGGLRGSAGCCPECSWLEPWSKYSIGDCLYCKERKEEMIVGGIEDSESSILYL